MNKILLVGVLSLLLVSSVSSYYCIYAEDNDAVKEFKFTVDKLAIQEEYNNGLTDEQLAVKLKYFGPCR